eukprot:SAG31_NODE_1629_length_7702_cov_6.380902_5_plen_73_part_00
MNSGEEPGSLRKAIVLKRSYAHRDFEQDYNSFKGNAYGLNAACDTDACRAIHNLRDLNVLQAWLTHCSRRRI